MASPRVQITLSTLQMQDAAVARDAQRLGDVRNKCLGAENKSNGRGVSLTGNDCRSVKSASERSGQVG
jgi:hypothetical protein